MRWKMPLGVFTLAMLVMAASSTPADAQWRRGPGLRGPAVRVGVYVGQRFGYPFWGPFGFYPQFPFPYPYGYRRYGVSADLRIQVEPKNAEVFVDGHYAGLVDDFDGVFQRLKVTPGGHEIQIYLDGFKTIVDRRYFSPNKGYSIKERMIRLGPGESSGPKPTPPPEPQEEQPEPGLYQPRQPGAMPPPRPGLPPQPPPPGQPEERPVVVEPGTEPSTFGQLAIRVQPADAQITVDGEVWQGAPGQARLVIDLPAGVHRVEIKKEGFAPFSRQVTIKARETTVLNVSLSGAT